MRLRTGLPSFGALWLTASVSAAQSTEVAPPLTPATAPDVASVSVRGEKSPPGRRTLSREEVRQLPGAFGDPFRAIEALPGVTPIASGAPFFYVRGAPPGNVGYFVDGVRVPFLFHVGLGPSVVHPALIRQVDLHSGGYPARFGRFAGGIVSGETEEPRTDLHGEGGVRLFDLGALAETGFAEGRGTVLLGGRYSYSGALLSLIVPEVALDYRDYQARVTYDLTPKDRLSVLTFGSYDFLGDVKNGVKSPFFASEFYRADVRYDRRFAENSTMRVAVTLGFDQTRIAEERNGQTRMIGSRLEVRHPVNGNLTVRGGADVTAQAYGATTLPHDDPDNPDVQRRNALFPKRTDTAVGGWVDLVVTLMRDVEVTPGIRVDLFTSGGAARVGVDPRLAARFKASDHVRILHAYGIVHQPPSFIAPVPGLTPGTLSGGLQTSFQTSGGVEMELLAALTGGVTLFHNAFLNMTDAAGSSSDYDVTSTDFTSTDARRTRGSAVGVEIMMRRSLTKRLGGFVSYTLSRSIRSGDRETFPSNFDRTHVANAALGYDLGRGYRVGTRLVVYTGTPKSYPASGLIVPARPQPPDRGPAFFRLDLRFEKRWAVGPRDGWISFVAEVLNATLSTETFSSGVGPPKTIGPITIPSIGIEGGL